MRIRRRRRPLRPHALPPLRAQRPAAARGLARPVAQLRRRPAASRRAARSSAARSTSASRTSTSRTTTARRSAPPRRPSAGSCATDLAPYRDELIISTKAGLRHVAGAVRRMGLAQVPAREPRPEPDAAWASTTSTSSTRHRFDPDTPLEETMGALDTRRAPGQGAVRRHLLLQRRADAARPRRSCATSARRCLIHQPSYSHARPLDRGRSCSTCSASEGIGCIVFSPLAQGLLTDRYLDGIPEGSRASSAGTSRTTGSPSDLRDRLRALNEIAERARTVARAAGARVDAARPRA